MTVEQLVWHWFKLSDLDRKKAARRMLEDGRFALNDQMQLEPCGERFLGSERDQVISDS